MRSLYLPLIALSFIFASRAPAHDAAPKRLSTCAALDIALEAVANDDSAYVAGHAGSPLLEAAVRTLAIQADAARREVLRYYELECDFLSGDRDV